MACVASTEIAPAPVSDQAPSFDAAAPWQRSRSVALRPEPFGALVYHFGNRKLSFLKSPELVRVVESLEAHPSADDAVRACGIAEESVPAYRNALASLARSQMIERRS